MGRVPKTAVVEDVHLQNTSLCTLVPTFCLLQDIRTEKRLDWIYPQYLLTTTPLCSHSFPLILYFLSSKVGASKQASIGTLKNKASSVSWEVSQQKWSQIL